MRIIRPWAFWRRLQYGTGFALFWCLVGAAVYVSYFYQPPNCFDEQQNGSERGIDCGGGCVRICVSDVTAPTVAWAESFKIVDGQYNAVAYVQNPNPTSATPALRYTFRLLENGSTIAERSGVTILPPGSVYPIFEGRIFTEDGRAPTETTIEIEPATLWLPATLGRTQFRTTDIALLGADARPRLNVKLENTDVADARDVEVVATIFNQAGEPVTASQTFIDSLPGRSTRDVVFTWPEPIAQTVRSCDVPSDIMVVLDRSGSMAADGGSPPEPLESAKRAAQTFVELLRPTDQVGFVSYATMPTSPIEQVLTSNKATALTAIASTKMGTDGVQYTNMGEAFAVALAELTSARHREDARKVIVFLTDGDVTRPVNPATGQADRDYARTFALTAANRAKEENVTIYSIGFGDFFADANEAVARDIDLIKSIASDPANYFEAPTITELEIVYRTIATTICEAGPARVDVIPKTDANFTPLR